MSELVLTLLRLSYLVLLWLLVLSCVGVLRRDIFGTKVSSRSAARRRGRAGAGDASGAEASDGEHVRSQPVTLVVLEGPLAGTTLELRTSAVLIGRAPSCTLVVDDDYASGRHTRIFPHDGGWYAEDLGSTNGTWVGEERIDGPTPVPLGVQVTIGRTVLELRGRP
ncbi:FHA domain-containing protein FhaB/FipA [Miniimonas arenae]|uniref:FHA domain-containing protein FhaB/FipA n=1 Tax=Miniimonas arenae TaxID=676201 RepID=UPI0028ACBA53|nr:FHA domain-containing protein [Miniimonas arenae]